MSADLLAPAVAHAQQGRGRLDPRRRSAQEWTLRGAVAVSLSILVAATLLSAGVSVWERQRVNGIQAELRTRLRPAQIAVADLTRAYVDQQTGQRGYTLTGRRSFLQPYETGRRDGERLHQRLGQLMGHDAGSAPLLAAAAVSALRWQQEAAEREITARQRGPISSAQTVAFAIEGARLFDTLRQRLSGVAQRIDQLTQARLAEVLAAQSRANLATALAALVAIGMAGWSAFAFPRMATRPIAGLLRELDQVASGDTSRHITATGPSEVRAIARAAETMRTALVSSSTALAAAQQKVGAAGERERMARQVGDNTLHRLYALTLGLSMLRVSRPQLDGSVRPLVDQADAIAQELRGIIYPLPSEGEQPGDDRR